MTFPSSPVFWLLSSKPTYLLTWPAFAFRQWGNVLSVSVSVSVLCVSPGSSGRPWGLATPGLHRDTLGTVMKTPLGICRTVLVSENQAWNETSQWTEHCHSNHAWTDQPWGRRNSESQRDCVLCCAAACGCERTQNNPDCASVLFCASLLCLLAHMEGKLASDTSFLHGWKQTFLSWWWCLLTVIPVHITKTQRVLRWHYLPCSWWGRLKHDHPDYHSSLQLSCFTLKDWPLKAAYLWNIKGILLRLYGRPQLYHHILHL